LAIFLQGFPPGKRTTRLSQDALANGGPIPWRRNPLAAGVRHGRVGSGGEIGTAAGDGVTRRHLNALYVDRQSRAFAPLAHFLRRGRAIPLCPENRGSFTEQSALGQQRVGVLFGVPPVKNGRNPSQSRKRGNPHGRRI